MKLILKIIPLILASFILTACGDDIPKFDGSSKESMSKSMESIAAKLPEEKKDMFKQAIAGSYMQAMVKNKFNKLGKSPEEVEREITSKLDGKTGEEIIDLFNSKALVN
jgi:hypothetical protein